MLSSAADEKPKEEAKKAEPKKDGELCVPV
jgi:hypothetical protein